jgi:hypothetical protein
VIKLVLGGERWPGVLSRREKGMFKKDRIMEIANDPEKFIEKMLKHGAIVTKLDIRYEDVSNARAFNTTVRPRITIEMKVMPGLHLAG